MSYYDDIPPDKDDDPVPVLLICAIALVGAIVIVVLRQLFFPS